MAAVKNDRNRFQHFIYGHILLHLCKPAQPALKIPFHARFDSGKKQQFPRQINLGILMKTDPPPPRDMIEDLQQAVQSGQLPLRPQAHNQASFGVPKQPPQSWWKQSKTAQILRWILILPAAVSAYSLSQVVIALVNFAVPDIFVSLWNSVAAPMFYILAGVVVAPRHKFATAVTLTVLHALAIGMLFGFILSRGTSIPMWQLVVSAVLGISCTVAVCVGARKADDEEF